jgi:hypothetical protein
MMVDKVFTQTELIKKIKDAAPINLGIKLDVRTNPSNGTTDKESFKIGSGRLI